MLKLQKKWLLYFPYKKRFLLIVLMCLLLVGVAVVWILNYLNILKGPWTSILSIIFTVLSLFFSLLQFILPISKEASKADKSWGYSIKSENGELAEITDRSLIQVRGTDLGISLQTGALIIYTRRDKVGEAIDLRRNPNQPLLHSTSSITRRIVNGKAVYAAIFPYLAPSDYIASEASGKYKTNITVLPNQLTEIDWRGLNL